MKHSPGDYLTDSTRGALAPPTRNELSIVAGAAVLAALLLWIDGATDHRVESRWLGTFLAASVVSSGCLWALAALVRRRAGSEPTTSTLALLLLVFVGGLGPPLGVFSGLALDAAAGGDPFFARTGFAWASVVVLGPALELAWRHWHVGSLRQRDDAATLQRLAFRDALTGLPNRREFERTLQACIDAATPFAVMFLDFDKFKQINDTHGHAIGDEFLVVVSRRLQALLRRDDLAARLGGDEFAVIVRGDAASDTVLAMAGRVVRGMSEPYALTGVTLHSSASIGVAIAGKAAVKMEDVVHAADLAMYRAKKAGGARFALAASHEDC